MTLRWHYPIIVCGADAESVHLVCHALGVFDDVHPADGRFDLHSPRCPPNLDPLSAIATTGQYGDALPEILKHYPRAMFLAIKRDPRDVVCRNINASRASEVIGNILDDFESAIAQREIIIQNAPNSFYLIRYEDLLGNPDGLQRTLAQLLGATYEQPLSSYLVYLGYTPGEPDSHELVDMSALEPGLRDRLIALVRREGYEQDDRWAKMP